MNTRLALLLAALLLFATPAWAQDGAGAEPTEQEDGKKKKERKKKRDKKADAEAEEADAGPVEEVAEEKPEKEKKEKKEKAPETATTYTGEIPDKPFVSLRTKWGVFGHAFSGLSYGNFINLESDLADPDPIADPQGRYGLGPNFSLNSLGAVYGGNIDFIIGRYLMIGGGGFGLWFNAAESTPEYNSDGFLDTATTFIPGQVSTGASFYTGHIGFLALHKARYALNSKDQRVYKYSILFYPYVGGGIGKINATINNYSANVIDFGDLSVEQAAFQDIEATTPVIEAGVSTKFAFNKKGGVMLGFDLGFYYALGGDWEDEAGNVIGNTEQGQVAGGYFRMSLGGGFLSLKPRNEWKTREKKDRSKGESDAAIEE